MWGAVVGGALVAWMPERFRGFADKRVFVFGDATHVVAAARIAAQEMGFTVSMGVASFPHTAHNQDELLAACESALAEAQRRGENIGVDWLDKLSRFPTD